MKDADEKTVTVPELLRFFSVLSHDLKSPIFSIDGFSELLHSEYAGRLDDDGRDFLERIRSSAQQLKRILEEMSRLIKLVSRPNASRPTNLSEIVDEIRLKFNYAFDDGAVGFSVPDDLPTVNVDPEKMREAIAVLISNALFFTDRAKGDRRVALEWSRDAGTHRFCVVDNGIGVDPRYVNQLFELGVKLDKARGGGPGYGLYLAKQVIESHGGTMTVDSVAGEGSRFCFTLPGA